MEVTEKDGNEGRRILLKSAIRRPRDGKNAKTVSPRLTASQNQILTTSVANSP